MNSVTREFVRRRADDRCEYCRLPQSTLPFTAFHIDHIVAVQHGGIDEGANLALACDRCNAFKGPNLTAVDPLSNVVVRLFDPRHHLWTDHFEQIGFEISGRTRIGRATVALLNMNAPHRVHLRTALQIRLVQG